MDRSLHHDLPVKDYHFNEDGTQIISIDQGDNIYVWDVKDGKKLTQLSLEIDEGAISLRLLTQSSMGRILDPSLIFSEAKITVM